MDIVYIIALVLCMILVCLLVISIRNLIRSKKELKQIMKLNEDPDISQTKN